MNATNQSYYEIYHINCFSFTHLLAVQNNNVTLEQSNYESFKIIDSLQLNILIVITSTKPHYRRFLK